ncbi:cysteine peptidase family C39 domain-containing protein [Synechococcus sp. CBW1107]|uniref:cysteine peptidase family C39 domain-containing protein n=1 Tax=Synechococcus sp. CBW1107 TaxID=2789857 RepID=UPI003A0FEF16
MRRYAFVEQHSEEDCGAAWQAMIVQHYGKKVSLHPPCPPAGKLRRGEWRRGSQWCHEPFRRLAALVGGGKGSQGAASSSGAAGVGPRPGSLLPGSALRGRRCFGRGGAAS